MTTITREEWIKALEDIQLKMPAEDGMTRQELAEALGLSPNATGQRLRELHRSGRLRAGHGTRAAIDGRRMVVPVYRLLP